MFIEEVVGALRYYLRFESMPLKSEMIGFALVNSYK